MPFISVNNTRLFYRLEGGEGLPVLVLSHSLGCDHAMWAPQMPDFLQHFQVLRYDTRGHGASESPRGEYSIVQLGGDLLGLVDALKISKFAFCGLSMGGAVGQWVATQAPGRVTALVLANSSPRLDPDAMESRRQTVLESGMAAVVETAMLRFFSPETLAHNPYARSVRSVFLGTDPAGYAGCCVALRDADHNQALPRIHAPTLLIVGDRDVSTPWAGHGEILAREIDGAQTIHLPATHLSNIERPRAFTTAVLEFLGRTTNAATFAADPLEAGIRVRRAVLGDEHVNRAESATNDFNADFQNMITRYAWGTVWTRPGLDRRTRRLLALAMMPALGRWEEFRLHLRAALSHGLESCDLKEVLLQVAIYAGVPAANTAFPIAQEEMEKHNAGSIRNHGEEPS